MIENADHEMAADPAARLRDDEALAFTNPEAVERRVWRNIFVVIGVAVAASAVFASLRFTLGVALGGALALLNYRWLHSSLREALAAGAEAAPPGTTLRFVLRWIIIAAAAYGANLTGYFDAVAILAGLFAPAAAVIIEAGYVAFKTLTGRNGER